MRVPQRACEHCGISVGVAFTDFAHRREVVRNFIALDFAPVIPPPPPPPTDRPSNLHISRRRRLVKACFCTSWEKFVDDTGKHPLCQLPTLTWNEPHKVIESLSCRTPCCWERGCNLGTITPWNRTTANERHISRVTDPDSRYDKRSVSHRLH